MSAIQGYFHAPISHEKGSEVVSTEYKGEEAMRFEGRASTNEKDSHGDIVIASGIMLDRYKGNPMVLLQHDHSKPIGVVKELEIREDGVYVNEAYVTIDRDNVFKALKTGVICSMSVGFMIKDFDDIAYDADTDTFYILKRELYEISLVSVPSNPGALIKNFKDIEGAEMDDEKYKKQFALNSFDNYSINDSLRGKLVQAKDAGFIKDITEQMKKELKSKINIIDKTKDVETVDEVVETTEEVTEEVATEVEATDVVEEATEEKSEEVATEEATEEVSDEAKLDIETEDKSDEEVSEEADEEETEEEVETEEKAEEVTEEAEETTEEANTCTGCNCNEVIAELQKEVAEMQEHMIEQSKTVAKIDSNVKSMTDRVIKNSATIETSELKPKLSLAAGEVEEKQSAFRKGMLGE